LLKGAACFGGDGGAGAAGTGAGLVRGLRTGGYTPSNTGFPCVLMGALATSLRASAIRLELRSTGYTWYPSSSSSSVAESSYVIG